MNAGNCKQVSEKVQGSDGKINDQSKNTYNQWGVNSSNPSNRASVEYHNNLPIISNIYSRYEPNSQCDRANKQGTNVVQTTSRNPKSQQKVQTSNNNAKNEKNS